MLDFNNSDGMINDLFDEGAFMDTIKKAADINDTTEKDWSNATTVHDKAKVINGVTSKTADNVGAISGVVGKQAVNTSSIIARARNSIQEFPIYMTRTIRPNAAHLIGKSFERVYASFFQTALAMNPVIDEDQANNLVFLKQFHSNIREGAEKLLNPFYEPIDDWDAMMQESIFSKREISDNCILEFRVVPTENTVLIEEAARLTHEPLEGFRSLMEADLTGVQVGNRASRELSDAQVNELLVSVKRKDLDVTKDDIKAADMSDRDIISLADAKVGNPPKDPGNGADQAAKDKYDQDLQEYKKNRQDEIDKLNKQKKDSADKIADGTKKLKSLIHNGKIEDYILDGAGRICRTDNSYKIDPTPVDVPVLLKDGDIKKINGMLPYTIEATFRMKSRDGALRDVKYLIGVKTTLHPIRTQDLAEDLRELIMGDIKSLRKVRYKTGELSFKDYMFNIKGLKADASKHISYNKRWINTLKRLAEYKKLHGSLFKKPVEAMANGSVPIPNGTLVLSQPDVTTLANQTGVDLSEVANAKRLARTLFLIAVVIVDSSEGTMRVLFPDSSDDWDVQSLASIDAEMAKTDNSQLMRELNKIVNR